MEESVRIQYFARTLCFEPAVSVLLQATVNSHSEGGGRLFEDLTLTVNTGERLGLVGHNGCGKTTLLALLAGAKTADDGMVRPRKGLRLAMLEQFVPKRLERVGALEAVLDASLDEAQAWRAEALLFQLGFEESSLLTPLTELSGGKQTLVLFARTLLGEPDLLLLDEPSNHLDVESLVALERRLLDFRGAFVIVSHDRRFLDRVTEETLFMRDQAILRIRRPYSEARRRLDSMDEAARSLRAAQNKRIEALRRSAQRMAQWGRDFDNQDLSKRAKAMRKRIERLEDQRTFVTSGSPLDLSLDLGSSRSKLALHIEDAEVVHPGLPGTTLFQVPSLTLRNGDRAALLGQNGIGKSTFIRMIVNAATKENTSSIRLSPQTKLGYFDQELSQVRGKSTMIDFALKRVADDLQTVTAVLASVGFDEATRSKPLDVLSGGERARLLFAVVSMLSPNLLILDEPTNHLDIEGREQIQGELSKSNATLLITSHDRVFTESLATRFFWIRDERLQEVPSPDAYFEAQQVPAGRRRETTRNAFLDLPDSEDEVLERIVELESKVEAMLRRKPKFQKQDQIDYWRKELSDLNRAL